MNHLQQSFELFKQGAHQLPNLERAFPNADVSSCKTAVEEFCQSALPRNHDDLVQLSQRQTALVMQINATHNKLRRERFARG